MNRGWGSCGPRLAARGKRPALCRPRSASVPHRLPGPAQPFGATMRWEQFAVLALLYAGYSAFYVTK